MRGLIGGLPFKSKVEQRIAYQFLKAYPYEYVRRLAKAQHLTIKAIVETPEL